MYILRSILAPHANKCKFPDKTTCYKYSDTLSKMSPRLVLTAVITYL